MQLIRRPHASLEVVGHSARIVIDPGEFGEPVDLTSTDAVFVTHDHFDHVSHALLATEVERRHAHGLAALQVFGPEAFAHAVPFNVTVMRDGDRVDVGDLSVAAVGKWQEPGSLTEAPTQNVGYVVNGKVLHPGDAYQSVDGIEVMLVALSGPWIRMTEMQQNVRQLHPATLIGIHDVQLGDLGRTFAKKTLSAFAADIDAQAVWLEPGQSITIN